MKKILTTIFVLFSCFVYSQNNSAFEIQYSVNVFYDSLKDNIRDSIYREMDEFYPDKQIIYIKKDSIIVEEFPNKTGPSTIMYIRNSEVNNRLDLISGKISKSSYPHFIKKYRSISNYKRIPDEDSNIINEECQAWISKSKNGWNKIWVSKISLKDSQLEYPDLIVNGYLVLKRIMYTKNNGINVNFEAKSIKKIDKPNFKSILDKHLIVDIKSKYLPISENKELSDRPIKVGDIVANYSFRNIFKNELTKLYDITKKKKYTIVEFWGTWCPPCLLANKKIKELKETYGNNLSILSINARDRNIGKLKKVIEQKQMNWEHGYTTEKLLKVFNKKGFFPRLVILNNKNKVLFGGNPQVDLEEIKTILNQ